MTCVTESIIYPREEGTAVIKFFCKDEDSNIVVPTTLFWQLVDKNENTINDQEFASNDISGTQQSITIDSETGQGFVVVLSGDDLALSSDTDEGERYFGIKGTYDSSYGNNLPLKDELKFTICNLKNIAE